MRMGLSGARPADELVKVTVRPRGGTAIWTYESSPHTPIVSHTHTHTQTHTHTRRAVVAKKADERGYTAVSLVCF